MNATKIIVCGDRGVRAGDSTPRFDIVFMTGIVLLNFDTTAVTLFVATMTVLAQALDFILDSFGSVSTDTAEPSFGRHFAAVGLGWINLDKI